MEALAYEANKKKSFVKKSWYFSYTDLVLWLVKRIFLLLKAYFNLTRKYLFMERKFAVKSVSLGIGAFGGILSPRPSQKGKKNRTLVQGTSQ